MKFNRSSSLVGLALAAASLVLLAGCATSSFGNGYGYDEQACVERALRRTTDLETVARASREFKDQCEHGGAEACSALGVMNEVGMGVPKNVVHAVALYERACKAGNQRGCTNLGIARAEGLTGPAAPAEAARLLEPACDGHDARACAYLAHMHEEGRGVAKDPHQAARLLELACNGEEAAACRTLGDMLATANRRQAAMEFYGKGCLNGDAVSCGRLAAPHARAEGAVAER